MNAIDPAFDRLQKLEAELKAALAAKPNEADTRLKVLDRILFEVLEWKHEAVFAEPPTASGYIDYLLTIGERRGAMVIEAKKKGLTFVGHVPDAVRAAEASEAGQKSIEHFTGIFEGCSTIEDQLLIGPKTLGQNVSTYDAGRAQALIAVMARNQTWQVPTLVWERGQWLVDDIDLRQDPLTIYAPAAWKDRTWPMFVESIIKDGGYGMVSDRSAIALAVDAALAGNPKAVEDLKAPTEMNDRQLQHHERESARQQKPRQFGLALAPHQLEMGGGAGQQQENRRAEMGDPARQEIGGIGLGQVRRIERSVAEKIADVI